MRAIAARVLTIRHPQDSQDKHSDLAHRRDSLSITHFLPELA